MKTIKNTALFLFIFLAAATLVAQQKADDFKNFDSRFEVFTLPGGAPGNSVMCIVQDSAGFLWFASQTGLHRYDGQSIVTYRHDPLNSNSLSSDYVEWIFQDSKGVLWLAHWNGGGLTAFDPEREIFTRYKHDPDNPESLSDDNLNNVVEDRQGYIWVGGPGGLDRLDRKTGKFKHFRHDPNDPHSLSHNFVWKLYVDRQGTLWVGTGFIWDPQQKLGGLNRYDSKTETFTRYLHDPAAPNSLAHNQVRSLFEDSKGNFWVGTGGDGLHWMDRGKGTFTRLSYDPLNPSKPSRPFLRSLLPAAQPAFSHVSSISEDQEGLVWITAAGGGLNVYDPDSGNMRHFEQEPGEGNLANNFLWQTCQTRDGAIWIASAEGGGKVFKVKRHGGIFTFFEAPLFPDRGEFVRGIVRDRAGDVWVGYENGAPLVRIDHKIGAWKTIRHNDRAPGGFNAKQVAGLSIDREGFLWISTDNGLFRRDSKTGKFKHFKPDAINPISGKNWFGPILQDRKGYIWAPGWGSGLHRLDPKTGKFTNFRHHANGVTDPESLGGDFVWGLYEDAQGNLFAGGGNMDNDVAYPLFLDRFNPDDGKGTFTHFIKEKEVGSASSITGDDKGNIWFVDQSNGIQKLNPADGSRQKFTPANSNLNTRILISLGKAKNGRLWFNSNKNVHEFDPESGQFYTYSEAHGVRTGNMGESKIHIAADGEMLIAGRNGFIAFYPDKILREKNSRPPDVRITAFKLFDKRVTPGKGSVLKKPIWQTSTLRLAQDQNVFSFAITCFDFQNPAANQLQFMLEGFDKTWRNDLLNGETPPYINLPPGEYTFRARGANSLGIWNMEGVSLRITILPSWWKGWWAYKVYGVLIFGFLFWLRRSELKKQKKRLALERQKLEQEQKINEQLRRVDALKDQFLANTSHELRTPLQGIIGLSEHLYDEAESLTPAEFRENLAMTISSGKRLNSLVNDILDFSKLKNADIELQLRPVSLHAMADVVLKNMTPLVAGKNLRLLNEVSVDLTAEADENRLQQILFNLVGNAVKFTETGHVKIGARPGNEPDLTTFQKLSNLPANLLTIFVEDTGIGIPADKQEAIFQEFVQGDTSTTRQFTGTGLGLSVSKKLVELHGGTMRLKSEEGKGSTFYFSLPMASAQADSGRETLVSPKKIDTLARLAPPVDAPVPTETHHSSLIAHHSISILVVDDEPVNQQVLKNHLSAAHYRITAALNGEEALAMLSNGGQDRAFDLVLLDVMMPRMSGYEVCEKIRERYLPSELPVIMITAKNQVEDLVQGLNTGANDYLAKPFSKEEFLARVKTQLNLHRINEATGKFVPNEFLRSLGRANITEVLLGDHAEREVTVLFADIRDYTTLSENMTPEENFNFVMAFNGRMGPIIQQHRGFVNQYLGDAIMAIFPENPADGLAAAIEMQHSLADYNERRTAKGRQPIRVGMGMHTGRLIMGIIGDDRRLDAATISDTVNTASRLESLSKYYGANLILSKNSLDKLADPTAFRVRYLGKVQVKGKNKPVKVFECFDGDKPDVVEKKLATLAAFEEGMKSYLDKQFAAAIVAFEAVLKQNPDDATARLFLNKAAHFVAHGVPEAWTGVEMMEEK